MEPKDAYICYNSNDFEWVQRLAEQLESETIDGGKTSRRLRAFLDRWDMGPGASLIDSMNTGMAAARHIVTVLTPEFLEADWPRFEWKHIVAADPNNQSGRLIPLLYRDLGLDGKTRINLPAPFRDLKYIDFRRSSDFRTSFTELVRKIRNMPPERGRRLAPIAISAPALVPRPSESECAWVPDQVAECLFGNMLVVRNLPSSVWSAETIFREQTKPKIWEAVPDCHPFILREGKLYTFADLSENGEPLRNVVHCNSVKPEARNDWFLNVDRERWLVALLNTCLASALRKRRIRTDGKGRFYFVPTADGEDRTWNMPIGKSRTVAKRIQSKLGDSEFWVHHGARLHFRLLGQRVVLMIVPLYLFTENGFTTIGGKTAGKLSHMWMGKQQNADIFRDVLFWSYVLHNARQCAQIATGSTPIELDPVPAATRMNVGIANDRVDFRTLLNFRASELEEAAADIEELERMEDDDENPEEQ